MRAIAIILAIICSPWQLAASAERPSGAFCFAENQEEISKPDLLTVFLTTTDVLIDHFWGASFANTPTQYYFNTRSDQADLKHEWWWQAHAMDVVIDAYRLTGNKRYLQMYEQWYDGILRYNYERWSDDPWRNNSIDDMEWIAITLIRMYETTGEKKYIHQAQRLFDKYIITTWGPDDEEPWFGGISWSTDPRLSKTKNACSNGPAGIIASQLACWRSDNKGKEDNKYAQDLKKIYQWERKYLFDPTTGAVYDHLGKNGVAKHLHSYNLGTFIAMAVDLYNLTDDTLYINDAQKAADITIKTFSDPETGVMNRVSRMDKGGDAGLFHGIFFRYFTKFINCKDLPNDKRIYYQTFLQKNVDCAIGCLKPGVNIFSKDWKRETITSTQRAPLTPHVTGCTLLSAALSLSIDLESQYKDK